MMNYPECVVCGVTIYASELYLCAEHQAWHRGWVRVPRVVQLAHDVYNGYRSDWPWSNLSHLDRQNAADITKLGLQMPQTSWWVTVHDIDRRAAYWLDKPDEGAA